MFYSNFKKLCLKKGLSEMIVAQECGISKASVATWRKGTQPRNETIKKIADYFQVEPSTLLNEDPKQIAQAEYSEKEQLIILRYRQTIEMQKAIDKLLDIDSE